MNGEGTSIYHYEKLANGLRIIVTEMPVRDSIAVGIWVKVGGRYEPERLCGIAHFTEHLLFKGTKNRSARKIKEAIEGLGGVFNAFTGEESTCYFVKILKEHFALSLDVLADMVKNPLFRESDIERERTVILEEIKMYQDQPSQLVQERMSQLLWPDQPLGRFLAGTTESVSRIRRSDFAAFKRRYYLPQNLLVSVCGDIPAKKVVQEVEKHFVGVSGGTLSQFEKAVSRQRKTRFDFFEKETEQTHLVMGLHSFSRSNPEKYKVGLLSILLGGNMSSRLFEEVREKRGLAYEIRSSVSYYEDTGAFTITAGVETKKLPLTIRVVLKELKKIARQSISENELRRAKDFYLGQLYLTLEDTLDHMLWLGEKGLYQGRIPLRSEIQSAVDSITPRQIQSLARELFQPEALNVACVGPVGAKLQKRIKKEFELA